MPATATPRVVVIDAEGFTINVGDDHADVVHDEGRWVLRWDGDTTDLGIAYLTDVEDALSAALGELDFNGPVPTPVCNGRPKVPVLEGDDPRTARWVGSCEFCSNAVSAAYRPTEGDPVTAMWPAHSYFDGMVVA